MICDQTNGNIFCFITLICCTGQLTDLITDCFHRINVKYTESTSCTTTAKRSSPIPVSIFLLYQFGITTFAIPVKLGKYIVPDLHISGHSHSLPYSPAFHSRIFHRDHNRSQNMDHKDLHHAPRSYHTHRSTR